MNSIKVKKQPDLENIEILIFFIFIPLIFFCVTYWFMPINQVIQFDPDEGIQLAKAMAYADGFEFHTEIWSDQPYLSTNILGFWINKFGDTILYPRTVILIVSSILIGFFGYLSFLTTTNIFASTLSVFCLALSSHYLQLSVSVMIGVPSLTFLTASIFFLMLYLKNKVFYNLIFSGAFLSLSLQVKIFTAFLFPLFIIFIYLKNKKENRFEIIKSISIWLISFSIITVPLLFFSSTFSYEQLFSTHVTGTEGYSYPDPIYSKMLTQDSYLLPVVFLGFIELFRSKDLLKIFPAIWLISSCIIFYRYQPLWYHHYLLISIPLLWIFAYGMKFIFEYLEKIYKKFKANKTIKVSQAIIMILLILALSIPISYIPTRISQLNSKNNFFIVMDQKVNHQEFIDMINQYQQTNKKEWLLTDMPIYGFYSGLRIPPELAVISAKRISRKSWNNEILNQVLEKYNPQQIVLRRFPQFHDYLLFNTNLQEKYNKVYETSLGVHYVRKKN